MLRYCDWRNLPSDGRISRYLAAFDFVTLKTDAHLEEFLRNPVRLGVCPCKRRFTLAFGNALAWSLDAVFHNHVNRRIGQRYLCVMFPHGGDDVSDFSVWHLAGG